MNKTVRRILPVGTFVAGVTATALIIGPFSAANADTATAAKTVNQTTTQVVDTAALQAKLAHLAAVTAKTPPAPTSNQSIKIGNTEGRISFWRISSRKLWVDGTDTGWVARYDVHVRRADGKVIFDENLSVYKMAWFANNFNVNTHYASEAALVAALNKAAATTEVDARAAFKKSVGTLGTFKTTDGKNETPYDPSQHPGHPYIPLDSIGG